MERGHLLCRRRPTPLARLDGPDRRTSRKQTETTTRSILAEIGSFAKHETATRTCARGHVLETMNTTQDKDAGSGFKAEIEALAATTTNSFDRLAAQCRDAGCTGGR